jgi:hypothetical protein
VAGAGIDVILHLPSVLGPVTKSPEIAGTAASMTESDAGVESEKASHNTPG